jgi:hypothetical protein
LFHKKEIKLDIQNKIDRHKLELISIESEIYRLEKSIPEKKRLRRELMGVVAALENVKEEMEKDELENSGSVEEMPIGDEDGTD